jgi:hypothetical protein
MNAIMNPFPFVFIEKDTFFLYLGSSKEKEGAMVPNGTILDFVATIRFY